MTEAEEAAYLDGERATLRRIMLDCAHRLGADDPAAVAARVIAERDEAHAALRAMIVEWGGEPVEPGLHLVDVVRILEETLPEPGEEAMTVDELIAQLQRFRGDAPIGVLPGDGPLRVTYMGDREVTLTGYRFADAPIPPEMLRIWCDGATGDWHDASGRVCCGTIDEAEAAQIAARRAAERIGADGADVAGEAPVTVLLLTASAGWLLQRQTAPDDWDLVSHGPLVEVPATEAEARRVGRGLGAPASAVLEAHDGGWRLSWRPRGRPTRETPRRQPVTVWLDASQVAELDAEAAACGEPRGEVMRRRAFAGRVIS